MNQENFQSVYEMDLSQYGIKTIKNIQKVIKLFLDLQQRLIKYLNYFASHIKFSNLKMLDVSCNKITKIDNFNLKV
jgi:Leucine-rich repeat (LRR) protein